MAASGAIAPLRLPDGTAQLVTTSIAAAADQPGGAGSPSAEARQNGG